MSKDKRFEVDMSSTSNGTMTNIIVDKETGVQYLLAIYPNVGSGLTLLVDKDGKPLLASLNK